MAKITQQLQLDYPPRKVSWLKRDVILFAHSIGCSANDLQFLYELHPEFQVFPTYPIVLTFKYGNIDTVDFLAENGSVDLPPACPPLDWSRAVDGRRRISIYRQLPHTSRGRSFEIQSKVLGVYDKGSGKGSVLEKVHTLVDKNTGEVYSRAWESAFFVGTGGWGGERGPPMQTFHPPHRPADFVDSYQTTAETAHLYRLNGDYNPLHGTPEPGQALGYGGIILHGLFSWNVAAQCILRRYCHSQGKCFRDFEASFSAPVRPGDTLQIHMWNMGVVDEQSPQVEERSEELVEVRFEVKVKNRLVLAHGRALLALGTNNGELKL